MRIARVSLGAAARGMTQRGDVASPASGEATPRAEAPAAARVYLRPPERADRVEFVALMRASRAFHRPWATAPTDDEAFEAYLVDSRRHDFEAMLACRREDRAILGFFNLSHITRGSLQSAYLGYAVGSPFANQGYMREGIEMVLREAFLTLRLHRIEANIQPGNDASIALARGAGFSREGFSPRYLKIGGRWRDHERWAILAEDWRGRAERLGLPTVL
jgi:[ribosomal protein S5]-alanine N-acetyltransferase